MVSGINSVSNVTAKQNFGCKRCCDFERHYMERKQPSKLATMAKSAGRNFVAGAIISAAFDGVISGFNAIRKNPAGVLKGKEIAQRAGIWGLCWVAASAALALVFPERK